MTFLEFGSKSQRKIVLIHGFQSPWQVWEKYIEHYKNDFHIIVPVISGHDPAKKEDFISLAKDAAEIEDYILSNCGKNVYAVFGMSMGGVLAAALWHNNRLNIQKVIFDGSPLVSVNSIMKRFMLNFYLDVTHKSQKRDKKTLQQAGAICPNECMEDFLKVLDNMSDKTIVNCINNIAGFDIKNIKTAPTADVYYFHGTAVNEMLAKKSAKCVKKYHPNTVIKCFKGKAHCENSLFNPQYMIKELDAVLFD